MRRWPTPMPEYRWPSHYLSPGMAAVRFLLDGAFHVAYALGLLASLIYRGRLRVLVIRTDGLGDGLLFEPALESLARMMSPRVVHLWAPGLTCEMFRYNPAVRRLCVIPRGFKQGNLSYFGSFKWRTKIGFELGRWTFDKVIYPVESPEPLGNWLFISARASERWLNYGDTVNQFDWQRGHAHERATMILENRPGHAHELVRNEYLATQWGEERQLRSPKVYLTEAMQQRAQMQVDAWRTQARKGGASEIVGVMPAASMQIKAYPDAQWAQALKRLWDEQRVMPVVLGGPSDRSVMDRLIAELISQEVPHLQMTRPMSLLDMTAIVGKLDGLLSVDTGIAHLAVAQNTPTVVLSTGGAPGRFFPWPRAEHHRVLNHSMPCAGCSDRCSLPEAECITHIQPDDIVRAYAHLKGRHLSIEVHVAERPAATRKSRRQAAG
jgi:ADP-heptose:LPS heptosyltransferase